MRSLALLIPALLVLTLVMATAAFAAQKPLASYNALIIQPFTVDPDLLANKDFPGGCENVLEKTLLARLLNDQVFPKVIEGSDRMVVSLMGKTLILDGEVTEFSKGNRTARAAVGYGAGAAIIKLVVTFRELDGRREVLRLEQTGRYIGFGNLTGGSAETARNESARKVVDGLIKKIKAAR